MNAMKMKRMNSVLITGGSSGIGEALAVACAQRGVRNIFLCGRDAGGLSAVVKKCENAQRQALKFWGQTLQIVLYCKLWGPCKQ